jgi:hypothetical protein
MVSMCHHTLLIGMLAPFVLAGCDLILALRVRQDLFPALTDGCVAATVAKHR